MTFKKSLKFFNVLAVLLLPHPIAQATGHSICDQLAISDIMEMDLAELSEIPVFLSANQKATCANEAAGIVTVITGEEIRNMGARDLIDVLQLVPGFNFGVDVSNVVGLGIRGIR